MSVKPVKCNVIIAWPKPKVVNGQFFPEDHCGTYGFRAKNSFAIPMQVGATTVEDRKGRITKPFFVIDPTTGLAQPVGSATLKIVETWAQKDEKGEILASLQQALELAMQKRYVKAMTLKARDLIETLIVGSAGLGIGLFILHMIGVLTGNQVTI